MRRVAAQGHSDLLALERTEGDSGKLRTVIQVDDVRRTVGFLRLDRRRGRLARLHRRRGRRAERRGRQCAAEDPGGAAAKIAAAGGEPRAGPAAADHPLALPPARRCGRSPQEDVAHAVADALGRDAGEADIKAAALAADGSVARALELLARHRAGVRERVNDAARRAAGGRPARRCMRSATRSATRRDGADRRSSMRCATGSAPG